jgi:hypothetical protein
MQHLTAELIAQQHIADMRREASTLRGTPDGELAARDGVSPIRRWLATLRPMKPSTPSVRHRVVRL